MTTPPPQGPAQPYPVPYGAPQPHPGQSPYGAPQPQQAQVPYGAPQSYPGQSPYGAPQSYPGQSPYGAPQSYPGPGPNEYGGAAQPFPGQGPQQAPVVACEVCGGLPAAAVTVRGHQGLVVLMRFLKREGDYCRDCGLAVFRQMSADTMWQGWWSPLSLIWTPITLLMNLEARARLRKLPAPQGGWRAPEDPGKPLWLRVPALLVLVPVCLALVAVTALLGIGLVVGSGSASGGDTLSVGDCAVNHEQWPEQDLERVDCGASDADYTVRTDPCGPGDYVADLRYSADGSTAYCLAPRD